MDRDTMRQTDRQTDRERDRQTDIQRPEDINADRQRDRQPDRLTQTDSQTDKARRHECRLYQWLYIGTTVFRGKFFHIPRASLPNSAAHRGRFSTRSNKSSTAPEPGQMYSISRNWQIQCWQYCR